MSIFTITCAKCGGFNDQQEHCNFCTGCDKKEHEKSMIHPPHEKQIYSAKKGMRTYIKNKH